MLAEKANAEIINRRLSADRLFIELRDLSGIVQISPDIEKSAKRRLERGNPPGKENSLGDRLNWKVLLSKVPNGNDIHVLSRDKDFTSPLGAEVPNSYLAEEWAHIKNGSYYVYSGIRSFTKKHFPDIVIASDAEKRLAIRALVESGSWSQTHAAIARLTPLSSDFMDEDAKELFTALLSNPEVRAVSSDTDVNEFFDELQMSHWKVLSTEEFEKVDAMIDFSVPF